MRNFILISMFSILSILCNAQTPKKIQYQYDALNRLTKVTYPNGQAITYNYDVLGNRNTVVVVCATSASFPIGTQVAGKYQVVQSIDSRKDVNTPTEYIAGKNILLLPGFQAGKNEVFKAEIRGCN